MGYYYGKARVTKKPIHHALSLIVPILWHTVFDMFIIAIHVALGPGGIDELRKTVSGMSMEQMSADPLLGKLLVYAAGMIIVTLICLITLIVSLHKVSKWSKQEMLQERIR